MLYYLPKGKITIQGEYAASEQTPTATPTSTPTPTPTPTIDSPLTANPTTSKPPQQKARKGTHGGKDAVSGEGSTTISGGQLKITVSSRVEADQDAGVYYVSPKTNDIFEDEVQVTVNTKHLLSAGKVTTEDKTAEIVGTIASIAARVAEKVAAAPTAAPLPFYFSFDPSNRGQVDFVETQLKHRGICLSLSTSAQGQILREGTVKKLAEERGKSGLVFRPAAIYNLKLVYPVDPKSGKTPELIIINDTEQFILPDRTKLYAMRFDRMPFVKKLREVGFSDGMLTDFHQKRPSPILGFLGIPKAIVDAIVPIPGAAPPTGSGSASGTSGAH